MSTEFVQLRARARDKRDKLIAEARREYEATLVQIATLEQDLLGKISSRHKSISSCIESVIPRADTFTTVDIMASLEALDPGRVWRPSSLHNHIARLRDKGLVKRLKRATIHEPAVYARVDVPAQVVPLSDATLSEVIRSVLVRPMTATEVAVAVLEAGYSSTMTRKNLRNHIARVLKRTGFKCEGGKWVP